MGRHERLRRPARPSPLSFPAPGTPSRSHPQPSAISVPDTSPAPEQDAACIVISLTDGNLRNNYISLADHLNFFPADSIGAASAKDGTGVPLTLRFAGLPGSVYTDIAAGHKIFRSRGPWRRFFACHDLAAGDSIVVERLSAREYRITPRGSKRVVGVVDSQPRRTGRPKPQ